MEIPPPPHAHVTLHKWMLSLQSSDLSLHLLINSLCFLFSLFSWGQSKDVCRLYVFYGNREACRSFKEIFYFSFTSCFKKKSLFCKDQKLCYSCCLQTINMIWRSGVSLFSWLHLWNKAVTRDERLLLLSTWKTKMHFLFYSYKTSGQKWNWSKLFFISFLISWYWNVHS